MSDPVVERMHTRLERRLMTMLPVAVESSLDHTLGALETWRHALSQGGMGPQPFPDQVVEALMELRPRLVRIFVHEFFKVYEGEGVFNWKLLDTYLEAIVRTGATVVGALCIKPKALFPVVDYRRLEPTDPDEWANLLKALTRRYSVDRRIITHWEILNEPDLANGGGAPFSAPDPQDYFDFYRAATGAILEVAPDVKVGGPAVSRGVDVEPLPGFVARCKEHGTRLDFLSWHRYNSDADAQARIVKAAKSLVEEMPGPPELFITEWNKRWSPIRVAESDDDPGWAAVVVAIAISLLEAGVDYAFYYHAWEHAINPQHQVDFKPAESMPRLISNFNGRPFRLGMLDDIGNARAHYFAMRALASMEPTRINTTVSSTSGVSATGGVRVLTSRGDSAVTGLVVSDPTLTDQDRVVTWTLTGVPWGQVRYRLDRLDAERRWDPTSRQLRPLEDRQFWTYGGLVGVEFVLPAGSVAIVRIEELPAHHDSYTQEGDNIR